MRVLVVGSARHDESKSEAVANAGRDIGRALVGRKHTIIVGSDSDLDIDRYVLEGANSVQGEHEILVYCPPERPKEGQDSNSIPFEAEVEKFKNLKMRYQRERGPWEKTAVTAIVDADAVLLIGGRQAVEIMGEIAPCLRKPVLPIPFFGGKAQELWRLFENTYSTTIGDDKEDLTVKWKPSSATAAVSLLEKLYQKNPFKNLRSDGTIKPTRILSLSGGGIRGIFQAKYLANIAKQLDRPLKTYFDVVAGTSTGAIIALGIALGIDLDRIVSLFENHGREIFPPRGRIRRRLSWLWYGPRYDPAPLHRLLMETFRDPDGRQLQLKDCNPKVMIAAATLDRYQVRHFTNMGSGKDNDLLACDVALASAAAPLFFPAFKPRGQDRTYVDGGVWANNPALMAVLETNRRLGARFEDMRLISVGNGEMPGGQVGVDFNRIFRARMISPVLDLMFSTQSELADTAALCLLKDESRVLRVNIGLDTFIDLDDARQAARLLPPLAEASAHSGVNGFMRIIGP